MKPIAKLLTFFLAITIAACNNKPIDEIEGFDYGTVKDNEYTNKFFDIKVSIPAGWKVQSQEENKALMADGADLVAGDNATVKKAMKAAEVNSANLLTVFQYATEAAPGYNPNFLMVAENLKNALTIKTAKDYLDQTKTLMRTSQLPIKSINEKYENITVNGIDFTTMDIVMEVEGTEVYQKYICTIKDGFALGFIYSYVDQQQKTMLDKVVQSISPYRR